MKKDYIKNKFSAEELKAKIQNWYDRRGVEGVCVWVEKVKTPNNTFEYYIRSNLKFNVDNIKNGLLE